MTRSDNNVALSWNECKQIVAEDRLELLGRSDTQQSSYDEFTRGIKDKYEHVKDYLFVSKFGFEAEASPITGKLRVNILPGSLSTDRLNLCINDFPYNYEEGIAHYVLWKLGTQLTEKEIVDAQDSLLRDERLGAKDACWYVNPPHLKSILEIDHAHILVLASASPTLSN